MTEQFQAKFLAALEKKREIDKKLSENEAHVHAYERVFLEESCTNGGNVLNGYDDRYKKLGKDTPALQPYEVQDVDRMFSGSSLTYEKALEFKAAADKQSK